MVDYDGNMEDVLADGHLLCTRDLNSVEERRPSFFFFFFFVCLFLFCIN